MVRFMHREGNNSQVVVWLLIAAAAAFWVYCEPQIVGYTILALLMPFYFFGWNALLVVIGVLVFWFITVQHREREK